MIDGSVAQLRQPLTVTSSLAPTAPCSSSSRWPLPSPAPDLTTTGPTSTLVRLPSRRRHPTPANIDPADRPRAAPQAQSALTDRPDRAQRFKQMLASPPWRRSPDHRPSSRPPAEVAKLSSATPARPGRLRPAAGRCIARQGGLVRAYPTAALVRRALASPLLTMVAVPRGRSGRLNRSPARGATAPVHGPDRSNAR